MYDVNHRTTTKLWKFKLNWENALSYALACSPIATWQVYNEPTTVKTFLVSTCRLKSNCISYIYFAHHLHLPVTIVAAWLPSKQNVSQPVALSANQEMHLAADAFFSSFFAFQDSSCTATIWFCPFLFVVCVGTFGNLSANLYAVGHLKEPTCKREKALTKQLSKRIKSEFSEQRTNLLNISRCCWGLSAHRFYPPFRSCSLAQNPSEWALMASLQAWLSGSSGMKNFQSRDVRDGILHKPRILGFFGTGIAWHFIPGFYQKSTRSLGISLSAHRFCQFHTFGGLFCL